MIGNSDIKRTTDNYEIYYADKLWNMLPAIYRTLDTDTYNSNGPLREMVNRIGKQAAIVRCSIDRLWEDQSIETCDDWVIPYIADFSQVVCFGFGSEGDPYCFDYREDRDQPSIIYWADAYWRRVAPDFETLLTLIEPVDS